MVKEDSGTGMKAIGFSVIGSLPVSGGFCDGVWAAGVEWGIFGSWNAVGVAEALTGGGVEKADGALGEADGLENVESRLHVALECLHWHFKGESD